MAMQAPARRLTTHQQAVLVQVLLAFPEQRVGIQAHRRLADACVRAKFSGDLQGMWVECGCKMRRELFPSIDTAGLAIVCGRSAFACPARRRCATLCEFIRWKWRSYAKLARRLMRASLFCGSGQTLSKTAVRQTFKYRGLENGLNFGIEAYVCRGDAVDGEGVLAAYVRKMKEAADVVVLIVAGEQGLDFRAGERKSRERCRLAKISWPSTDISPRVPAKTSWGHGAVRRPWVTPYAKCTAEMRVREAARGAVV